jgi:hypothetical protein
VAYPETDSDRELEFLHDGDSGESERDEAVVAAVPLELA